MKWKQLAVPWVIALSLAAVPCQAAVQLQIQEYARTPTELWLYIDDVKVEHLLGETRTVLTYNPSNFPFAPPRGAWVRINFVEPGTTAVQATIEFQAEPNGDGMTSTLLLVVKSGSAARRLLPENGKPDPVDVEEAADPATGNTLIQENDGTVDVDGNPIDPSKIGGASGALTAVFHSD